MTLPNLYRPISDLICLALCVDLSYATCEKFIAPTLVAIEPGLLCSFNVGVGTRTNTIILAISTISITMIFWNLWIIY